jgi:hypothetical protein
MDDIIFYELPLAQPHLQMHQEHLLHLFLFTKLHHSSVNATRYRKIRWPNPETKAISPRKATQTSVAETTLFKSKVRAEICRHYYCV